jgi:hypothetical protein
MKKLLLAASAALALCAPAHAATFKSINHGKSIVMTGEIVPGDVQRLHDAGVAAERKYSHGQPIVERIFLNSPGGDVVAGLELADFVHRWTGLATVIGKTDVCASMCAVVFAAGSHKVVFPQSHLGVHSVSSFNSNADGSLGENLGEDAGSLALTTLVARTMADYGVPDGIITRMMMTRQPDVYWVTDRDGWTAVEVLP